MKKYPALLITAFVLVAGVAQARVPGFVRVIGGSFDVNVPGYGNTGAFGVGAGVLLGSGEEHELSAETVFAGWKYNTYNNDEKVQSWTTVLVNYRYHVYSDNKAVSLYFGPSLGGMFVSDDAGSYVVDKSSFTYGGSVGVRFKVAQHWDVDVGYRRLWTTIEMWNNRKVEGSLVYGSVGWRW